MKKRGKKNSEYKPKAQPWCRVGGAGMKKRRERGVEEGKIGKEKK